MSETPTRPNAETRRHGAGGAQLRRELAEAAAALELADLDTSNAHLAELWQIALAHRRDRGRPYSIVELHAMAVGELPGFPASPGPEALKALRRVGAKCVLRTKYGLPHHPCAQEYGGCRCLDEALAQVLDEAEAAA